MNQARKNHERFGLDGDMEIRNATLASKNNFRVWGINNITGQPTVSKFDK